MNSHVHGGDRFDVEVVRSGLTAIGDEMFAALQRTSKSPIIYETLDYAVGATDWRGRLITQGNGVTGFLGTLDGAVQAVLQKFGEAGAIEPGDVFITNDPYTGGGTHLSDVSLVAPVFVAGELLAFVANKAHWTELGGKDPGSWTTDATEIFQEGLQFPNVRLIHKGQPDTGLLDLLAANVRLPDMTLGDLWAGVAALRVGERRLTELARKHGHDTVRRAMDVLLAHGETLSRLALGRLPHGTFFAEDYIDDDGLGNGPFRVCVNVTIDDDRFLVDFTGSHPQVAGPINCTWTGLVSEVRAAFKAVSTPNEPTNEGQFRPLQIVCPPRTIFTAERPAPVSTYWETKRYSCDLVWRALAPHLPERLPAGHLLSVCGTVVSGIHPDTGDFFLLVEPLVGGWGAGHDKDGENGQFCVGDGETYNIPIEITETRYGVLVDQYAFHNEDGGAGRYRGGKGVVLDYRITADEVMLTGTYGRFKFPPWGLAGGHEGSRNYMRILRADGSSEVYGKVARARLHKGDVARLVTATGGGYGNPRERDGRQLEADLKNGYLTPLQVERAYRPRPVESAPLEGGGVADGDPP